MAGAVLFWLILVIAVPDVRPGFVEFTVGIALGLPVGYFYSKASIGYLASIAAASREHPSYKLLAFFVRPLQFNGPSLLDTSARVLAGAIGLFGISGVLDIIGQAFPWLVWPWARFSLSQQDVIFESWPLSVIVYGITTFLMVQWRTVRWYRALPDDPGAES